MGVADAIEDLYVLLTGDAAPLLAAFAQVTAAGEEMAAAVTASMAEVKAAMAESLAGADVGAASGAGIAALGAEAQAAEAEVTAAVASIDSELGSMGITAQSSAAEVKTAFAEMGASLDATAAKMTTLSDENAAMLAKMQADNAALATSAGEAGMATTAVGDAMAGTTAKAAETNTTLGMSNNALLAVGAAAVGTAYEAVKMGADFQTSITKLNTTAGEAKGNLDMVSQGILNMAGQVGYSSQQLANAMYMVESSGQHGQQALDTLKASAQGAKSEQADLTVVTNAVTDAMKDYGPAAGSAADVTSKLIEATSQGKMSFQDLAGAMSAILPKASAAKESFNDILAMLASMTVHGESAQQSAENLADALQHMAAPTMAQSKELAALGINATQLSQSLSQQGLSGAVNEVATAIQNQMGPGTTEVVLNLQNALKGLPPAVQQLGQQVLTGTTTLKDFTAQVKTLDPISAKQAQSFATLAGTMHTIGTQSLSGAQVMQTYTGAMGKAMGTSAGLNVALMTTGENLSTTQDDIKKITAATADADGTVMGFTETQGNLNAKLDDAKAAFGSLVTSIGLGLIPILTPLVSMLGTAAQFLAQHKTIATILATVLGVALVGAVGALVVSFGRFVALKSYDFFAGIVSGAKDAIKWIAALDAESITAAASSVVSAATTAAAWIAANAAMLLATGGILLVIGLLVAGAYELITHWQGVKDFFSSLWSGIKNIFSDVAGFFSKVFGDITKVITGGPAEWGRVMGEAAGYLTKKAWEMIQGIYHGVVDGAKALNDWILNFPHMVTSGFAAAGTWLLHAGEDLVTGLWHGAQAAWDGFWAWIVGLPGAILNFFANAPSMLYNVGSDIITGLWNGFTSFLGNIWSGIGDFVTNFIKGFLTGFGVASPSTVMFGIGVDVIVGLWNGFTSWVGNVFSGIGNFIQGVIGQFAGAASWLVSAGYNICVGLYNGIASGWSMLTNMVSNLASSLLNTAKSALGISSPSRLFADQVGAWIAPGLAQGIDSTSDRAVAATRNMVARLANAASGQFSASIGGGGGTGGVSLGALGAGGAGGVNVQVNVAGHVWTTGDLVTEIQQQLLRHNTRNSSNATNYAYA